MRCPRLFCLSVLLIASITLVRSAEAQQPKTRQRVATAALKFPPQLPNGELVVTHSSSEFLVGTATIGKDVAIAKTPPSIDFLYYPGQDYEGKPWSNWGDGVAVGGKYYSAIGDHLAIGAKDDGQHGTGTGLLFEYDPDSKAIRTLVDTTKLLNLPAGHYTPGKIHSRLDLGDDGWLYFATHRGSDRSTTDQYHYQGDWVLRCHPPSGRSEVVVHGPVSRHCVPTSVLDPERLIFYGGTAAGKDATSQGIQFFAFDVRRNKLLYTGPDGPARYMIFARSTGRVYYMPGNESERGTLMRFDPTTGSPPVAVKGTLGIRAATQETPQGIVYTVSSGQGGTEPTLWSFDVKTETISNLGSAAVGSATYITSLDADPTGRYLYYVPGAHGGGERDGSAVVQFDLKTRTRKVIAFLHPFFKDRYGATLVGTFSSAVDPRGDKVYITWNVNRGGKSWDCCALTVIHIPASERL